MYTKWPYGEIVTGGGAYMKNMECTSDRKLDMVSVVIVAKVEDGYWQGHYLPWNHSVLPEIDYSYIWFYFPKPLHINV